MMDTLQIKSVATIILAMMTVCVFPLYAHAAPVGTYTGTSFDTNGSGNGNPTGIAFYNDFFWVADDFDDEVYKYTTSGTYTGVSFDTAASGNGLPFGMVAYNNFFWITDDFNDEVYKYNTDGTYTGTSFDTNASGNDTPQGIAAYNGFLWIVDPLDDEVYKYTTNGTYTNVSFDTAASGNGNPSDIIAYGGFFWIADDFDDEVYKYNVDGTYTGFSFDTAASGNGSTGGIATYDGFFWIVDTTDDEVYKYYGLGSSFSKPANNLGLVGYWSFDDATSTRATDFSGNGNTGTLTNVDSGIPTWVNGKRGKALNFDQGEVQASQSTTLNGNGSTMTIALWMKAPAPTESFGQFIMKDDLSSGWQIQTFDVDPDLYIRVDTSGGTNQTPCGAHALTNVYDNQWHHIVFVLNAGSCTSYKDGVAGGSGSYMVGGGFANTSTLRIRGDGGAGGTYVHTLDDVRIYNRALSASEVAALYGNNTAGAVQLGASSQAIQSGTMLGSGLIDLWTFDGYDFSDKVYDRSSGNDNGYFTGGATSSAKAQGKLGQGIDFDGVNDFVGTWDLFGGLTRFSIGFWIKSDEVTACSVANGGLADCPTIIGTDTTGAGSDDFGIVVKDGALAHWHGLNGAANNNYISTIALSDGGWHHVVAVYDGSATVLYHNGALIAGSSLSADGSSVASAQTGFGAQVDSVGALEDFANVTLDDMRIYNRALSAAEAKQLYQLGQVTVRP